MDKDVELPSIHYDGFVKPVDVVEIVRRMYAVKKMRRICRIKIARPIHGIGIVR